MSEQLDIDIFDLLTRIGVENLSPASGGSEAQFSCPLHQDERPSAYMNCDSGLFMCHSCHQRGNTPQFVSQVMGVPYATAANWLREAYGVDFREPEGGTMSAETDARFASPQSLPQLRQPEATWLTTLMSNLYSDMGTRAYEYVVGRGFSPDAISSWQLGYDPVSDRLTIPVRDLDGALVGFKGRGLDDAATPKFLILGDYKIPSYGFDAYEASQVVFGLDRGRGCDMVVLCESELDAVALSQAGVGRPVAIGMSYLTDVHAHLLVRECREVVSFFDSDKAGFDGLHGHVAADGRRLQGALDALEPHVVVRVVEHHDRDPAKMIQDGDGDLLHGMIERAQTSVASGFVLR